MIDWWDLQGQCVFRPKLLALVVKQLAFLLKEKKPFAVGMSVRSTLANDGVWKLTDQSLPG